MSSTTSKKYTMPVDGGYVLENSDDTNGLVWYIVPNDEWEIQIYQPNGSEEFVGKMRNDGHPYCVFKCSDGKFRAALMYACPVKN
jgi:hypothetical protein